MGSAYNYRYSCVVGEILDMKDEIMSLLTDFGEFTLDMFLLNGIIKDDNWRFSFEFCSSCRSLHIKYIFYHLIDWF